MIRSATTSRGKAAGPVARIELSRDYNRVLKAGVRRSRPGFTLAAAAGENGPRLGLIVPKSVGRAVDRNRAKRIVREGVRLHPEAFETARDYVVILRPGLLRHPTRKIWMDLTEAAREINGHLAAKSGNPRGGTAHHDR